MTADKEAAEAFEAWWDEPMRTSEKDAARDAWNEATNRERERVSAILASLTTPDLSYDYQEGWNDARDHVEQRVKEG